MEKELKKIELDLEKGSLVKEFSQEKKKKGKRLSKFLLVIFGLFFLVLLTVGIIGGFVLLGFKDLIAEESSLQNNLAEFKIAVKEQNLEKVKTAIGKSRETLSRVETKIGKVDWAKSLPIVKDYVSDMEHGTKAGVAGLDAAELVTESILPYADILGLAGAKVATGSGKTAMDRITFIITTLDKIKPQFDQINEKLMVVKNELDKIDPERYPEKFRGVRVRDLVNAGILAADQAAVLMKDARPLLEVLPKLLGMDSEKHYLVIFQNDGELRPTGGFITAYGILKVVQGKITPLLSQDIYSLDDQLKKTEPAPEPLVKYLKHPYGEEAKSGIKPQWRVRDMNLSPDFAVSMAKFYEYYKKLPGDRRLDGIIAVNTKVLVNLFKVIGSIGVPEWGNFSAEIDKRCDCPQVVYRLEELADKPISGTNLSRKAVIAPLMHSVLANAFQSPKSKMPLLFEAGMRSITEKHLLIYLFDQEAQKAVEAFNLAGRIKDYDQDYFHLNDSNFGGAKSNLFIKQKIEQKFEIGQDGSVTKTVIITYTNPAPGSNCNLEKGGLCLNGLYRDWVRLYVPKGSTLISASGLEGETKTYEELGKTVFEGFYGNKFPLNPKSFTKVTFKYQLPFKVKEGEEYKLLIQKQSGIEAYEYLLDFNGQKQEFELRADQELKFKI